MINDLMLAVVGYYLGLIQRNAKPAKSGLFYLGPI
jgi:hypothetical protein